MKKRSVLLILVVIVIALSSCSQEKLGNFMGWMGNNVYGIKPDLRKPNAAISVIDSISGTSELNLSDSRKLIDLVEEFKGSSSSVEAFRNSMSEAVNTSPEAFDAVKDDLSAKVEEIKDDPSLDVNARDIMVVLKEAVDSMSGAVFASPTRRDVVTVAMVNELVNHVYDTVKDGTFDKNKLASSASGVLDVLKLSTDFSEINFIGDIDMSSLIDSLLSRDISRADSKVAVHVVGKTVGKVTGLITSNGRFDSDRYDRFIMEARAVEATYEMVMAPYVFLDEDVTMLDMMTRAPSQSGLVVDDLTTFLSTGVVSLMKKMESIPNGLWLDFLESYLQGDTVVALSDLKNNASMLKNPTDSIGDTIKDSFYGGIADEMGIEDVDISEAGDGSEIWTKEQIAEDLLNNLYNNITSAGGFSLVTFMQFLSPMIADVSAEDVATDEAAMNELVNILAEELVNAITESMETAHGEQIRVNAFFATIAGILVDVDLLSAISLL